jgi:uncharacterized membrane protein
VRIKESTAIHASPEHVWEEIVEPDNYPRFMTGVTRWDVEGEIREGLGARYKMLLRVGSAEVGGLIEIVEEIPRRDLAWTSVTGIDQRGRWRLREGGSGITRVELRFSYGVAGAGLGGWLSEQVSAPLVRRQIKASLAELKRIVEQRRRHREAEARRAGAL